MKVIFKKRKEIKMETLGMKIFVAVCNIGCILAAAIATVALIALIALRMEGDYTVYEGYCLVATVFGYLAAIPLGVGAKFIAED